jgi:hypothetical protein
MMSLQIYHDDSERKKVALLKYYHRTTISQDSFSLHLFQTLSFKHSDMEFILQNQSVIFTTSWSSPSRKLQAFVYCCMLVQHANLNLILMAIHKYKCMYYVVGI